MASSYFGCPGCGRWISQRGGRVARHNGYIDGKWTRCPVSGRPRVAGGHRTAPTTSVRTRSGDALNPEGPWKCADCDEQGESGFTAFHHNMLTDASASFERNEHGRWVWVVNGPAREVA